MRCKRCGTEMRKEYGCRRYKCPHCGNTLYKDDDDDSDDLMSAIIGSTVASCVTHDESPTSISVGDSFTDSTFDGGGFDL